jgi:Xaa-Pro aminopeptidase
MKLGASFGDFQLLRGIDVRIEDGLLITAQGARLMSHALPRAADAVEASMGALLDG